MRIKLAVLSMLYTLTLVAGGKGASSFPIGGDISLGADSFRSLPEGSYSGNVGAVVALNLACALHRQGIGVQGGGSFGVYEWDGRASTESKALQLQGFATAGLFRMTPQVSGINAGACYDWNIEGKYGVFGLSPTLTQLRGQFGYLFNGNNEFGILGAYAMDTAHEKANALPVDFKAISQVSVFWRNIFRNRGETMLWAGSPYEKGLMYRSGRAGIYIAGASFKAPLTHCLSMYGHGIYMGARKGSAAVKSRNYAANVSIGLTYSFGGVKAGSRPYFSLANNSTFLVDTNTNY